MVYPGCKDQKTLGVCLHAAVPSQTTLPREASQPTPLSTNASINTTVLLIRSLAVTEHLFPPAIRSGVVCILSSLAKITLETILGRWLLDGSRERWNRLLCLSIWQRCMLPWALASL
jgi:hypothetical protein